MNSMTFLEIMKAAGLMLLGIGLILYSVGKIIGHRRKNREA